MQLWCWCGVARTTTTLTLNGCGVGVVWLWYDCGAVVVRATPTPQPHHNFKRLWCWCGVGVVWCWCGAVVVRAGLGEGCHLWATVILVHWHTPCRTLRSASANLLPITRNISFGAPGFRLAAPAIRNNLPSNVPSCATLTTVRQHLKSHLFHSDFATV